MRKKSLMLLADIGAFTTNSTLKQFENVIKIPKKWGVTQQEMQK